MQGICYAGEKFLKMCKRSSAPGACPEITTFWADLKRHLTDLDLWMLPGKAKAHLGILGMLTSLRKLSLRVDLRPTHLSPGYSMSGKTLTLDLPHLALLRIYDFGDGEIVLSCPMLTEVRLIQTQALVIKVEDAVLEILELRECKGVSFAVKSAEHQLQGLKTLTVFKCKEIGRPIIEHLGRMQHLRTLIYDNFPAACVPRTFPQRLQKIDLQHVDWCCDLPEGLKQLCYLEDFTFKSDSKPWMFTQPWVELLPMHSLKDVTLGFARFIRLSVRGQIVFQQVCSSYG